jgi:hypothetical protein
MPTSLENVLRSCGKRRGQVGIIRAPEQWASDASRPKAPTAPIESFEPTAAHWFLFAVRTRHEPRERTLQMAMIMPT